MTTKKSLIVAAAAALTCCISAFAQQAPSTPPPPPEGGRPHPSPTPGESQERHHWHHDGAPDGQRPEAGRDGQRPEAWHHGEGTPGGERHEGWHHEAGAPGGPGGERHFEGHGEGHGPEGMRSPGGEHHFEGGRPGEHGEHGRPPEPPKQPKPFLGVMAAPVPPPVAAQLGLPEGFGLLVVEVMPNSPAATAGVQKYDVLKLLNDQQLIDSNQLSVLLNAAGKDKEVVLTVIRKAQEQKITAKVGEHLAAVHHPGMGGGMPPFGAPGFQDRIRAFHRHMMEEHAQKFRGEGRGEHEERVRGHGPHDQFGPRAEVSPEEILKEAQPGGGSELQVLTDSTLTTVDGAKSRLVVKDNDGEIEIATDDGKRVLTARNGEGEVVFTGPVDTEEQQKAMPEAVRAKLDAIKVMPMAKLADDTATTEEAPNAAPAETAEPAEAQ